MVLNIEGEGVEGVRGDFCIPGMKIGHIHSANIYGLNPTRQVPCPEKWGVGGERVTPRKWRRGELSDAWKPVRMDTGWTGLQGKQNLPLGMGVFGRAELS